MKKLIKPSGSPKRRLSASLAVLAVAAVTAVVTALLTVQPASAQSAAGSPQTVGLQFEDTAAGLAHPALTITC